MLDEFKAFLMRGNVIDLAVAVVIGAAFTAVVNGVVTGLLTPLIGMIISRDFTEMTFTINDSVFQYGLVVDAAIKFLAYSAVVFFGIVKPLALLAQRRRAAEPAEPESPVASDEAVLLAEIRDLLRQRPVP